MCEVSSKWAKLFFFKMLGHTHAHTHTHTHRTHTHTHTYTHTHTHIHTVHTYVYIHTHTPYTHLHTHTYTNSLVFNDTNTNNRWKNVFISFCNALFTKTINTINIIINTHNILTQGIFHNILTQGIMQEEKRSCQGEQALV